MRSMVITLIFLCVLCALSFGEGSGETGDAAGWANLRNGAAAFDSGDMQKAIEFFSEAAQSPDKGIAATGYYNHGTALALVAEAGGNPDDVPLLLESAYQSLKRAYALQGLSDQDRRNAQRNMQIIRERLSQLSEESQQNSDENSEESSESDEDQTGEQQESENQESENQESQSGEDEIEENGEQMEEQQVNDILDQEAENQERREILELKGGIVDVDKDW